MFNIEEVFSKKNQREAFAHFRQKGYGKGLDGVPLTDLENYWSLNQETILEDIYAERYEPGLVKNTVLLNGKGKRRIISSFNVVDRFITRLISQKLNRYYRDSFFDNSFAYQQNKGIQEAVSLAGRFIETGYSVKVEIDLKDFFNEISIERMLRILKKDIRDSRVISLISAYLYCDTSTDGEIHHQTKGLIQGNSMSPILSNMYLNNLDEFMEIEGYRWIRFADDISVFCQTKEEGQKVYSKAIAYIENECELKVNNRKSGLFNAFDRKMLGYHFFLHNKKVIIKKHKYEKKTNYKNWHPSAIEKVNKEYHLIQNGVLNKQDFSLLFENEQEKHHLPVEVIDQLNVYSNITLSSSVLQTVAGKKIRICFMDKYGEALGYFVPSNYKSTTIIRQYKIYLDDQERLKIAKKLEKAILHNIRANLRYYKKRGKPFNQQEHEISTKLKDINQASDLNQLMLIEARAREIYYSCFNDIYDNHFFHYKKRTRRPPKDAINALISFGNTLLYNRILHILWKSSLDPRVGIIHSANRRSNSLHLDLADIYKPIIVDRVIFSLINRKQLNSSHFRTVENGGVYLSDKGKRAFIAQFDKKLESVITLGTREYTYQGLLEREVQNFQRYVKYETKYRPFKYY